MTLIPSVGLFEKRYKVNVKKRTGTENRLTIDEILSSRPFRNLFLSSIRILVNKITFLSGLIGFTCHWKKIIDKIIIIRAFISLRLYNK